MTFKEKLQKEYPKIADKYCGCPKHLDYEDENGYEDYYDPTFVIEYLSREKIGTAELSVLREAKIKASSETKAIGKFMIQHQDICYRDITNTKEKKWWEIFK